MKPVDQDIFINDPQGRVGNCLQAVLASILELPLEAVPHFAAIQDNTWFDQLVYWVKERGYDIYDSDFNEFPEEYTMAIGKSDRGANHVVIFKNGVMVHDPHPSRTGIKNISWCAVLKKKQS